MQASVGKNIPVDPPPPSVLQQGWGRGYSYELDCVKVYWSRLVGHDERSGSEPDIRPPCPVAGTLAIASMVLGKTS